MGSVLCVLVECCLCSLPDLSDRPAHLILTSYTIQGDPNTAACFIVVRIKLREFVE